MISCTTLVESMVKADYALVVSVPCSFLEPLLTAIDLHPAIRHIAATSEAEAIGIAAGAWVGGINSAVIMQNSGFLDALNPISSLLLPYSIPMLLIVSGRGVPGVQDETHHRVAGSIFDKIATFIGLDFSWLEDELPIAIFSKIKMDRTETARPYVLGIGKNLLEPTSKAKRSNKKPCKVKRTAPEERDGVFTNNTPVIKRSDFIESLANVIDEEAVIIATTGYTGRELENLTPRPRNFPLAGSMGCASSVGLGVSLACEAPVLVLDGDGACLMRLGNLSTIAAQRPKKFVHVVISNGVYESTGCQKLPHLDFNFSGVALAAGYEKALRTSSLGEALDFVAAVMQKNIGPSLLELIVQPSINHRTPRLTGKLEERAIYLRSILQSGR